MLALWYGGSKLLAAPHTWTSVGQHSSRGCSELASLLWGLSKLGSEPFKKPRRSFSQFAGLRSSTPATRASSHPETINRGLELHGVAFVSGAGGGIGRECVAQLVRDGCSRIMATDANESTLAETASIAAQLNPKAKIITQVADITQPEAVDGLIKRTVEEFGRVDYGFNIAGITGKLDSIEKLTLDDYQLVESINARAVWQCERAEIAQMLTQAPLSTHDGRSGSRGVVVNVASICGFIGFPNSTPYTMSKHAVVGLTRGDSTSFAEKGIRVNVVCPGIVDTAMLSRTRDYSLEYCKKFTPMKRLGTPREVADVATFLASSRASYICGAVIPVDGGHTAQ